MDDIVLIPKVRLSYSSVIPGHVVFGEPKDWKQRIQKTFKQWEAGTLYKCTMAKFRVSPGLVKDFGWYRSISLGASPIECGFEAPETMHVLHITDKDVLMFLGAIPTECTLGVHKQQNEYYFLFGDQVVRIIASHDRMNREFICVEQNKTTT